MDEAIVSELERFVTQVGEDADIEIAAAYLFGSRARDDFTNESDVDLLVVSPDFAGQPTPTRAKPFYLAWEYPPDIELKCYTPNEFDDLSDQGTVARAAKEEGIAVA